MDNSFSFKRYCSFMTRYWYQNRNQLLFTMILTGGILLLFLLLLYLKSNLEGGVILGIAGIIGTAYLSLSNTIISSFAFKEYKSKAGRISAMMLPVKKSEKFLGIFTIYVVTFNIYILLIFLLFNLILCGIKGIDLFLMIKDVKFESMAVVIAYCIPIIIGGIGYVMIHSSAVYFLGSSIWPKLSYLKTFAACYAIQIIMTIIVPVTALILKLKSLLMTTDIENHILTVLWLSTIAIYLIDSILFYLAWRRFKSLQVSQRFLD